MYATNIYYGINDFISLFDQASERFIIKSVRISNKIHESNASEEEEVYFNFEE